MTDREEMLFLPGVTDDDNLDATRERAPDMVLVVVVDNPPPRCWPCWTSRP
jgi:hypothetical protein